MTDTVLKNLMSRAAMDHFQVAVHAIGDQANATLLGAIEEMVDTYGGDRRWRIEHAQIVDPADLPRFGRNSIIASMQPTHETSDWRMAEARMGIERLQGSYAWRSMLDNHVPLAFGSDFPVESPNPFPGLAAAISREDAQGQPRRRLDAAAAPDAGGGLRRLHPRRRLCRLRRRPARHARDRATWPTSSSSTATFSPMAPPRSRSARRG